MEGLIFTASIECASTKQRRRVLTLNRDAVANHPCGQLADNTDPNTNNKNKNNNMIPVHRVALKGQPAVLRR